MLLSENGRNEEKKRRSDDSKDKFILPEYERTFSEVATLSSPDVYPEIEPKNDIGYNAMLSSKATIIMLWKEQHIMHLFDNIVDHVKLHKNQELVGKTSRRGLIMPLHLWVLWNTSRTWKIIFFIMDLIGQMEDKFLLVSGTNISFLHTFVGSMLRGR